MSAYFIPPYRKFALPEDELWVCPVEHAGDSYIQLTTEPEAVECWTCCNERRVVGEVFDCDDCLEPGIRYQGQDLPAGWIEDTNGFHCTKCTPQEWRNAA